MHHSILLIIVKNILLETLGKGQLKTTKYYRENVSACGFQHCIIYIRKGSFSLVFQVGLFLDS